MDLIRWNVVFQFTASEDHTWEQTTPKVQYGIQFAKPADVSSSSTSTCTASSSTNNAPSQSSDRRKKKSRWDTS